MTAYVLVVVAAVAAVVAWAFARGPGVRTVSALGIAGLAGVAAIATLFEDPLAGDQRPVFVLFGAILAIAGGAVVTTAVFAQIDGAAGEADDSGSMHAAGELLRGGAWIGALERFSVFLTLAARWPEGIAVVLAVKGLGRYAELRSHAGTGAAERFIIGSLVSLAWAALASYLVFEPYVIAR
ncbi:hypothetical protein [Solicola gregarius]|uniref:Uncharacterized protein n=1 Tax=Solicola gregarius TaxID=2908642 RepID=A0AA46TI84_9ACTN|nr:hypothetical protein [Solicola gregarius]UYM05829.1 hypothetical protein L0C25_01760 [Solicola gregarius]